MRITRETEHQLCTKRLYNIIWKEGRLHHDVENDECISQARLISLATCSLSLGDRSAKNWEKTTFDGVQSPSSNSL
jgi:hypothetical protein